MRFAYADPPYLGQCARYGHQHDSQEFVQVYGGQCWDDLDTHRRLIETLVNDYPDGWALSASSPSLWDLLPLCPPDVRIGSWDKPFASFKPNVNPAYCWEPVIFRGGRERDRSELTVRDSFSASITLRRGLVGAKPQQFCEWVLQLLGYRDGDECDELIDLFPGTGVMSRVVAQKRLAI